MIHYAARIGPKHISDVAGRYGAGPHIICVRRRTSGDARVEAPAAGGSYASWMMTNGTGFRIYRLDGLINVNTMISGYDSFCALLSTSHADCWGGGGSGQLGDGSVNSSDVPVPVQAAS